MTISSVVSRSSAAYLVVGGAFLLFAADNILPVFVPAFPSAAFFMGQLLAAGWLALGSLNWNARSQILGGIYGRPIVYANTLFYTISALGTLRTATAAGASPWLWMIVVPSVIFAIAYGALMFRGPFDSRTAN